MANPFRIPVLTRRRIWLAFAAAIASDGLQMLFGFFGWFGPDQVIDAIAMILTTWLLGFHPLLLPTFLLELFPGVGMIPTWTGCVAAVVALRLRQSSSSNKPAPPIIPPPTVPSPPPPPPSPSPAPSSDIIDI
jgi:hypothetical protein